MKRFILGFLIGMLLTALLGYIVCSLRVGVVKGVHLSAVEVPVRNALDDIVATYDKGQTELAEAKVRLFRDRWDDYLSSDEGTNISQNIPFEIKSLQIESK